MLHSKIKSLTVLVEEADKKTLQAFAFSILLLVLCTSFIVFLNLCNSFVVYDKPILICADGGDGQAPA